MKTAHTLREDLASFARRAELEESLENGWVRCVACGHRCRIGPGKEGICRVRFNRDGALYAPHGYVAGLAIDPIEKKPFFHAFPGRAALSFGMLGCDYHCAYCQNWVTSQTLRDQAAIARTEPVTADRIVALAVTHNVPVLASTYNEPLITSEWAAEVFALASSRGIVCSYVSNGNGTPEVLAYLRPHLRLFKIDLKSFSQKKYRQLGGKIENVLATIRTLVAWGTWVEVVTLVVPGFNDSDAELEEIAGFLASVSPDIPWHVTAFHPDYAMTDPPPTPTATLLRAATIGEAAGLHFVYAGNIPGQVGRYENTRCPSCATVLIERSGYRVLHNVITGGRCPSCSTVIPGVWE